MKCDCCFCPTFFPVVLATVYVYAIFFLFSVVSVFCCFCFLFSVFCFCFFFSGRFSKRQAPERIFVSHVPCALRHHGFSFREEAERARFCRADHVCFRLEYLNVLLLTIHTSPR